MPIRFLPSGNDISSTNLPPLEPAAWNDVTEAALPEAGATINYIPPPSSASQKPKAAVRVLSVHPNLAIGLGLLRLELVERSWGLADYGSAVDPSYNEERGKLQVEVGGGEGRLLRVWGGRGRGWYTVAEELEGSIP
jgi:hypothetical protein